MVASTVASKYQPQILDLVLGTVVFFLLLLLIITIVFFTWRCRFKRRGNEETQPVYDEIQDGFIFQTTNVLIQCSGNSTATVVRFSVPEDHRICLQCGGSDSSDVVWTHRDRKVLVSRQGSYETNKDSQRYHLLSDGGLCLLRLDDSDGGAFSCNQHLVAELQVMTGEDFLVPAGRTLLLPCSDSSKRKKKWSQRREGGRWETLLTLFRNGTVRAERSRISLRNEALQIQDVQPEDSGEFLCNGKLQARLSVLTVQPEPTILQTTTRTTATAVVMETEEVEIKKKEKKTPVNALLMVAVAGMGLMILLMAGVCVLLTGMRCRRRRKHRCAAQSQEDTELQPWNTSNTQTEWEDSESPSPQEEAIHYASLGRPNWRGGPSRTPADQNQDHVIYSAVVTRPAAKQKASLLLRAL
ncbi:uncharacterized protein LOC117478442 isoform X2 [Trematomus bernacchii]|uniref:uncharacterized protein LOC117478442 isoform X2 n=1 Tax=Trematomus bernacchii TaxID=40690 RepID=UPI00146BF54D|nr:uncharacterized protein LOC117478442 isoform X2 [Trematomus bernacchii]